MDLSFLDKSSSVTPILVRLYDSHKLYGLAKDKKPMARVELISAVSDLLSMDLSAKEKDLIAEVLVELLNQAEIELRHALAERLALMDNAPLRLILQLANDEISIADPVLRLSSVLSDLDLVYIIKSKGADYWRSIAARKTLAVQIVDLLAQTRDFDTAMTLVENHSIQLTETALGVLSDIAQGSEILALPLLRRQEVTDEIAAALYKNAGSYIKKFIRENYELDNEVLLESIDELVVDLTDPSSESDFIPSSAMVNAAKRFQEKQLLTTKLMIGTLRRGQIAAFVAQFSVFTGLDVETLETVLSQSNGQGLAVACKAHGIAQQDFVSIFLLTNRMRNGSRMVDLKEMNRAIDYYSRITAQVARSIMHNSGQAN